MPSKPFRFTSQGITRTGRLTLTQLHSRFSTLVFNIDNNIEIAGILLNKILRRNRLRKVVIFIKNRCLSQMPKLLDYVRCPGYQSKFCYQEGGKVCDYSRVMVIESIEKGMYYG